MEQRTKEPQYQELVDVRQERGPVTLGLVGSHLWRNDPRHLGFLLARYKFCAKMLSGRSSVLEVGCGDGLGAAVMLQSVDRLHGIDFDPVFVEDARRQNAERPKATFEVWDITEGPVAGVYDAVYSLDVIEHVPSRLEKRFVENVRKSLPPHGVAIIGTPNVTAQSYASPGSKIGHVNLKDYKEFQELMESSFHNVFMFSMNDEVVHTGFYPMAHYLLALAVGCR